MSINPHVAFGVIAFGTIMLVLSYFLAKYWPGACAELWRRIRSPSASSIKKQSDELLAQMNRNIAERKARK